MSQGSAEVDTRLRLEDGSMALGIDGQIDVARAAAVWRSVAIQFDDYLAATGTPPETRLAWPKDVRRAEQAPHPLGGVRLRHLLAGVSKMTPLEIRDLAIAEVERSCGLRAAEIAGLDVGDVSEEGGGLVLGRASDGSSAMPLEPAASGTLGVYLLRGRPALSIDRLDAALFLSRAGRRLSEHRVARCLRMSMRGPEALGDWCP